MRSNQLPDARTSWEGSVPLGIPQAERSAGRTISLRCRLRRRLWHVLARQFTLVPLAALALARLIGRRPASGSGCEILLTGRFDSKNWILNHLGPLAASQECSRLWMVSAKPVPALPKVVAIYPPKWLMRVLGPTPARLLTFLGVALKKRPQIVGGFHIMVNGIVAIIVAHLAGARSMYFCVGGPAEVHDGGIHSADSLFKRMETADPAVERRLLKIVADSDIIITMGTRAVTFFREKGVTAAFHVVSGGIDSSRFQPARRAPVYDLILTGRLVEVKRIDVFLQAVKNVAERIPDVRAVIVGDGRLREELHSLCVNLGLDHNVSFAGHQENIETWLCQSKIFVLTSDSEGLSLSLMEAMMCGLPGVVSDVGDLGDLVENGVNGYLVPRRSPASFADPLVELLTDAQKLQAFSQAARHAALRYETQAAVRRWDQILHHNANCGS
jgi:glycosyltransferase involved in cell wall biosynthesis